MMYDSDKIWQDTFAQDIGEFDHPISIIKNIAGNHLISTKVLDDLF